MLNMYSYVVEFFFKKLHLFLKLALYLVVSGIKKLLEMSELPKFEEITELYQYYNLILYLIIYYI